MSKKKADGPTVSRFQKSWKQIVPRADMKLHPDNPRVIDKHAFKKLRESVKAGYVGGIVWNKRSGYLVAGHQRIQAFDELHGNQDYALEIDVIDVDEKEEKALLVRLNSEGLMGRWDMTALELIMAEFKEEDFAPLGFDKLDAQEFFPDASWSQFASERESPAVAADAAVLAEMGNARQNTSTTSDSAPALSEENDNEDSESEEPEEASPNASSGTPDVDRFRSEKHRHKREGAGSTDDDGDYLLKVVFASDGKRAVFLEAIGADTERLIVDGGLLADFMGIELEKANVASPQ
jgi:hypothetical protein